MAVIRRFAPGHQSVKAHTTQVDCYHQTVTAEDGTTYLHLTTFGSDDRAVPGKSSQSFQLDAYSARELVTIIETTFGRSDHRR